MDRIVGHYLSLLRNNVPNVLTIHAELEGMKQISFFRDFLTALRTHGIQTRKLDDLAGELMKNPSRVPCSGLISGTVDGRSGTLAVQQTVL